jgi:hypothetical protein
MHYVHISFEEKIQPKTLVPYILSVKAGSEHHQRGLGLMCVMGTRQKLT